MIPSYTIKTDSTSTAGMVYVGCANSVQASDSSAVWTIRRITINDNDFVVENAEGQSTPAYKWSDRTTLTYK